MKEEAIVLWVSVVGLALAIGAFIGAVIGWVLNLVALAHWTDGVGMLVLRIVGIFIAPIGAVLGWL